MTYILFRIREAGIFKFWFEDLNIKNRNEMLMLFENSDKSDDDEAEPLISGDLVGVFALLVIGLTLSMIIFVVEILCVKYVSCFRKNIKCVV